MVCVVLAAGTLSLVAVAGAGNYCVFSLFSLSPLFPKFFSLWFSPANFCGHGAGICGRRFEGMNFFSSVMRFNNNVNDCAKVPLAGWVQSFSFIKSPKAILDFFIITIGCGPPQLDWNLARGKFCGPIKVQLASPATKVGRTIPAVQISRLDSLFFLGILRWILCLWLHILWLHIFRKEGGRIEEKLGLKKTIEQGSLVKEGKE